MEGAGEAGPLFGGVEAVEYGGFDSVVVDDKG